MQTTSDPSITKHDTSLGGGITISTTPRAKTRVVTQSLDWFEVMFSSILPAQAQVVLQSTTLTEAHDAAALLQQYICYSLAATVYFRKYPFHTANQYLEAHRQTCMARTVNNIAVPDILMLSNLPTQSNNSSSAMSINRHTNNSSSSSSHTHTNNNSNYNSANRSGGSSAPASGICGFYNSHKGCNIVSCIYRHVCKQCASAAHGKTTCPQFTPAQGKNSKPKPTPAPKQ